jgi:hypothetical protein
VVAAETVCLFLGRPGDTTLAGSAGAAISVVTALAKAYVRGGEDWETNDEIDAVIITAAARLVTNPSQLGNDETLGPFSRSLRGGFTGWTLAELAALNRYRKLAM